MISSGKNYSLYFIILFLIIIGYWQVSFFSYALKWDLIDVVLPFRYYFSECIHSGFFPFWNPYQQTGTPFYADLQAPTYYPELIFTSLLGGYGVYTMYILFVIYLVIAAVGMYRLSYYFNNSRNASVIAALSYVFSGYVIGHGQHFFLLVGVAWIPFVIRSYIKLNQNKDMIDAIKAGLFVFLLLTGAYQALSIVMLYLLALLFIYYLLTAVVAKNLKTIWQLLKLNLLFAAIIILLDLPLIISTLEVIESVQRFEEGVGLDKVLAFGQPYTTLISFILPFLTVKDTGIFGNIDSSLINHYFGVITLLFFIISLFRKHTLLEYLLLGFGLLIFLMSFDFLPVGEFMYRYVPFINLFSVAAYVSIFGLLFFILFAANYIAYFEKNMAAERNKALITGSALLILLLTLIFFSVGKPDPYDIKSLLRSHYMEGMLKNLSIYQGIILQGCFHAVILSGYILLIAFHKRIRYATELIFMLFIAEIIVASQLNMNSTVVDMLHKPGRMQHDLALCPEGFPIPINDKIIFNDQQHAFYSPFWRNTYIFTKQISFDAFSSFELKTYSILDDDCPNLKNSVLDNHLFYFSDTILSLDGFSDSTVDVHKSSRYLYLSKENYNALSGNIVRTDPADRVKIIEFEPNKISITTNTQYDQYLTMLQTNYKGWNVFIDNKPATVYASNFNYRTIFLPGGDHIVKYEYRNKIILILYIISNILFTLCALFLGGYWLYRKNIKKRTYISIPLVVLLGIVLLLIINFSRKHKSQTAYQYYTTRWAEGKAAISITHDNEPKQNTHDSLTVSSGRKSLMMNRDTEFVPIAEIAWKNSELKNGTLAVTFSINSGSYSKALLVSEINHEWHACKTEKYIELLNEWNPVLYYRNIPRIKHGEVIKVYIWNKNKEQFLIENIKVNIFD